MARDTSITAGRIVHSVSRCWFSTKYRNVRFALNRQMYAEVTTNTTTTIFLIT